MTSTSLWLAVWGACSTGSSTKPTARLCSRQERSALRGSGRASRSAWDSLSGAEQCCCCAFATFLLESSPSLGDTASGY